MATKKNTINETTETFENVIFADRIINFGFGPNVCRLLFGVETGEGKVEGTTMVVLPTDQFLQAMKFMSVALKDNAEIKQSILNSIQTTSKILEDF